MTFTNTRSSTNNIF